MKDYGSSGRIDDWHGVRRYGWRSRRWSIRPPDPDNFSLILAARIDSLAGMPPPDLLPRFPPPNFISILLLFHSFTSG